MADHSPDDESRTLIHKRYLSPPDGPDKLARASILAAVSNGTSSARPGPDLPLGGYSAAEFDILTDSQISHMDAARALRRLHSAPPSRSATPAGPPETVYTDTEGESSGAENLTRGWRVWKEGEEDEASELEDDGDGAVILSLDNLDTTDSRFHVPNRAQAAISSSKHHAMPFPANRDELVAYLNLGLSPLKIFPSEPSAVKGEVICKAKMVLTDEGWKQTAQVCGAKLRSNDIYARHIKVAHLRYTRTEGTSLSMSRIVQYWGYQSTGRKSNLALKLQDCQFIRDLPLAGPRECNRVAKASTKRKGDFEMSLRSKKKKSEQEAE